MKVPVVTEAEELMKKRSFKIIDGWHRIAALQELAREAEGVPIYPRVCVLENINEVDAVVLAKHFNVKSGTLVKESFFDKIFWLKRIAKVCVTGKNEEIRKEADNQSSSKKKKKEKNDIIEEIEEDEYGRIRLKPAPLVKLIAEECKKRGSSLEDFLGDSATITRIKTTIAIGTCDETMDWIKNMTDSTDQEIEVTHNIYCFIMLPPPLIFLMSIPPFF